MKHMLLALGLIVLPVAAVADDARQSRPNEGAEQASRPVDRGFGQHDACFGDKYESDDDLNSENRISEEEILALLNSRTGV